MSRVFNYKPYSANQYEQAQFVYIEAQHVPDDHLREWCIYEARINNIGLIGEPEIKTSDSGVRSIKWRVA